MPDEPQLIYLEPDDEITSLIRRVRAAEGSSVVVVAPGRSRATSSTVALRLLAQVAEEQGRSLALVADAATRALAGEAGISAFASVAEAAAGGAYVSAAPAPRAPIHVVRDLPAAPRPELARLAPMVAAASDETVVTRLPTQPRAARRAAGPRVAVPRWPFLAVPLAILLAVGAALLPGATVRITAATSVIGPKSYQIQLPVAGHQSGDLSSTKPGTATGQRLEEVPATGSVTFSNWNTVAVEVPVGSHVSVAGTTAFATVKRIVVPRAHLKAGNKIEPSQESVGVSAVEPGPTGNVAAGAIDTVDSPSLRAFLRGFPDNANRLVTNRDPTTGGVETPHTVIQQSDVDAVVSAIKADLDAQLATILEGQADRVFADAPAGEAPKIDIPSDLLGQEDTATFELSGTLSYDRAYVARTDVEEQAKAQLLANTAAIPAGASIVDGSIEVTIGSATAGSQMQINASVRAQAAASIDTAAIRDRIAGKTVDEAKAALADVGDVSIDLWPGWVDRLPRLPFRISVETVTK